MKPAEFKAMKLEGLKAKDEEIREELFNLKMQNKAGTAENPLRIRFLKKDLARIKTEMTVRSKEASNDKGEA